MFKSQLFKGHISMCTKLMEDPESFEDISATNSDIDQIFIQAIDLNTNSNDITFNVRWASQGKSKHFQTTTNI